MENRCPLCQHASMSTFFHLPSVPTQDGVMAVSFEQARACPRGDITLQFCSTCGYCINSGHEKQKIQFDDYDFSLQYSPTYLKYLHTLSSSLIERCGLQNKKILEIGCGTGEFLEIITKMGNNQGIGIDPGFDFSAIEKTTKNDISYYREYYSSKHKYLDVDFIICRLVIDLLNDPFNLLSVIYDNVKDRPETLIYFEIFDAEYTFSENLIWNVVYEHHSWLTEESVVPFFELNNFEIVEINKIWNHEYLGVLIKPKKSNEVRKARTISQRYQEIIENFEKTSLETIRKAKTKVDQINETKIKTVAWGAGARAVTFFNLFPELKVDYIVDINPHRQGKYLPGSGQKIISPTEIVSENPELIIITNPTYAQEIKNQVHELNLKPEFWVL